MVFPIFVYFGGLIIACVIAKRLKTNIGILCMVFAFLVGSLGYGMSQAAIVNLWPTKIFYIIMVCNIFVAFIRQSGVMTGLSHRLLYLAKGNVKILPLVFFVTAFVLAFFGTGGYATPALVCPIAYMVAQDVGVNPLIFILACYSGKSIGGWVPWSGEGSIAVGFGDQFLGAGGGNTAIWLIMISTAVVYAIVYAGYYTINKGWKLSGDASRYMIKPEPFTKKQKQTLIVFAAAVGFCCLSMIAKSMFPCAFTKWVAAKFDIRLIFLVASIVLALLDVCPTSQAIKAVPWDIIIMLGGASMFVGLADTMGVTDTFIGWLSDTIPGYLIIPMIILIGGIMTMFVDGQIVVQTFGPMIPALVSLTGTPALGMYVALYTSIVCPGFSPVSTGGSMHLTGCVDEEQKAKMIPNMLIIAVCYIIVSIIVALAGWYKLFG